MINPENVLAEYKKQKLLPIRGTFSIRSGRVCPIGLLFRKNLAEAPRVLGHLYFQGFNRGFDGRPCGYEPEAQKGYADGKRTFALCEKEFGPIPYWEAQ